MTKNRIPVGTAIKVINKVNSIHAGQTGAVAADHGAYYLIKADDEAYSKAFKSSGRDGKHFQVDERAVVAVKD